MSFLTEYFEEYRQHPIRKTKICRPEDRWAKVKGKWLDPKKGTEDRVWTEEEIENFIKQTMKSLRGQSTYYNEHCAHLSQEFTNGAKLIIEIDKNLNEFKTRPFVPRPKKKKPCVKKDEVAEEKVEEVAIATAPKLAMKDTELMKVAKELYERDMDKPTLEPLPTHFRILGYIRPCRLKTGISDYQGGIARLAYEVVRDDRLPRFHAHNGCRPRWGYPPEGTRQPELDGAPYDGERLY